VAPLTRPPTRHRLSLAELRIDPLTGQRAIIAGARPAVRGASSVRTVPRRWIPNRTLR